MREFRNDDDTMRWIRRGGGLALLLIGWGFILRANHFHIGPAVVFICLAYFAGVAALYTLYRLGSTAVSANNEEDDEMSWGRPLGELEELDREKRALLKAIKEAEFDQAMGKLSKADADSMITIYRTRAIEVIKEIDVQNSLSGKAGTVRDRILREARARIEIEEKASAAPLVEKAKKKDKKGDKQKQRADKLADAVSAVAKKEASKGDDQADAPVDDKADDKVETVADDKVEAVAEAKPDLATDAAKVDAAEKADLAAAKSAAAAEPDIAAAKSDIAAAASKSEVAADESKVDDTAKSDIAAAKSEIAAAESSASDAKSDATSDATSDPKSEAKEAAR